MGQHPGVGDPLFQRRNFHAVADNIQNLPHHLVNLSVALLELPVLLRVDEVEGDVSDFPLRQFHAEFFLKQPRSIAGHVILLRVESAQVRCVEILDHHILPQPFFRESQMVSQRQVDVVHQLHMVGLHGVGNNAFCKVKILLPHLRRQADHIPHHRPLPQHEDLLDLILLQFVADGFPVTDTFS